MAFTATANLMLPATVTGSWPRPRWYTQSLWGRPLDTAMMDPWFRELFTDVHAVVVSDQARAGLDVLTTGDYLCLSQISSATHCARRMRMAAEPRAIVRFRGSGPRICDR